MNPIVFDGCFGWFHPGGGSRGVVLCSPVGEEADYVYFSWRRFAEQLAGVGLPTLRFDYPGLYNSLDLEEGRDPPTAWVESIKAAIGWLKTETGLEDVVLIGLRFGAGLALKCAEELGGVATLVLMAPVVSGVSYQRELALLAKLSEGGTAVAGQEAPHQAATLFTAERTFGVESLKCCQGAQRPAARVLVLSQAGSGVGKTLCERLKALGSEVFEQPFDGYAELMIRPELARYPEDAFGAVLDWLRENAPSTGLGPDPLVADRRVPCAKLFPHGAREIAMRFRDERPLFGIYCVPDTPREGRPGVIFLNTAAVPQAGMNRMWVSMARRLAAFGFTSLRFDLNGVGDSAPGPTTFQGAPLIEEASIDVAAAIRYLRDAGCSTITVFGFCWGAQLAYNVVLAESAVTGLVMINARRNFWDVATNDESLQTFSTYLRLLRDPAKWKSFKQGGISFREMTEFTGSLIRAAINAVHARVVNADTTRAKTKWKLHSLKARGTDTLLVHGNDDTFLTEFEDYFGVRRHAFASLLNIDTHFFPGVSHRFPAEQSLSELIQVVADHLGNAVRPAVSSNTAPAA